MKALIKRIFCMWMQTKWLKRIDKELQKADKLDIKLKAQRAFASHLWEKYNETFYTERSENAKSDR